MPRSPEATHRGGLGPAYLLPVLALLIVLPLLWHGPSCGHDFGFHLQSWMDAGAQMRGGRLLPRWAFSPAFNAGEPRFMFYPPLSWLLGSVLLLVLPAGVVPAAFTWLALTGAGLGMYNLARRFVPAPAACLAAAIYMANPYMLFTAFERTAYAELLAAAWMPLLFRAALSPLLEPVALAVPLALLWLTNAPAAVMGTYTLVLLVILRLLLALRLPLGNRAAAGATLLRAGTGLLLGLGLASFYLLPAGFERRYVQIAMAIIPNMRVEDNFLFGHTGYGPHDAVLHTASLVAVETLGIAALSLLAAALVRRRKRPESGGAPLAPLAPQAPLAVLTVLAVAIAVLLWHGTLPVWHVVPELAFLQFPWRLLSVLGCVLGLAAALALVRLPLSQTVAALLACGVVAGSTAIAIRPLRQVCEAEDLPQARVQRFASHHGVGATDEYTPTDADNDQLRWDDPAWWLATTLNAPAPGTVPNPAATILDYDQPPPMEQTVSGLAPMHLVLRLPQAEDLVLNLRDYPAWEVTVNGNSHPVRLGRDDGLLALALPAGEDTVDVRWRALPDVWLGDVLSALCGLAVVWRVGRSRRI